MKKPKPHILLQQDRTDCGVACLASLIEYFGGEESIERLRSLSGTSSQGTTLLGLFQAAQSCGLKAEGFQADIESLKKLKSPCILHVLQDNQFQHYVVSYGFTNDSFIIGDPAKGMAQYSPEFLSKIWVSKTLLTVTPTGNFMLKKEKDNRKFQWFKNQLIEDSSPLISALALGVVVSLLSISVAIFTQKLLDDFLPNHNTLKIFSGLALLVIILLVRSLLSIIRENFLLSQSRDFNSRTLRYFYQSLMRLPKAFFDTRSTGDFVARMNDSYRIQNAVSFLIGQTAMDVLIVLISTVFVFIYSMTAGFILLASIIFNFILVRWLRKNIITRQKAVMANYAINESNFIDTIKGIEVIKSSGKEDFFSHLTQRIFLNFQSALVNLGKIRIRLNFFTELIATIILVSILGICSWQVLNHTLKIGEMMGILSLTLVLLPAVSRLALVSLQLEEAKVAGNRMFEFTTVLPETSPLEKTSPPAPLPRGEGGDLTPGPSPKRRGEEESSPLPLCEKTQTVAERFKKFEIKNLSFRFPGRKQLLQNINMEIRRGELVALWGESGSGKSTLMQIAERFYLPEEGDLFINNIASHEIPLAQWRALMGYVPQEIKIFNGTVLFNLTLSEKEEEQLQAVIFCKQSGLEPLIMQLPQGYHTFIGESGVNLSGGQKQWLGIARVLLRKPGLLLLDEVTAAMDRNTELFIFALLEKYKSQTGILLISHKIQSVFKADRIYLLEAGTIKISGTHEELNSQGNSYATACREMRKVGK